MSNINKIYLSGETLTDADFRCEDGPIAWVKLRTFDDFVDEVGEKYSMVQDHNLIAIGKVAEKLKTLVTKGMKIEVWGKINYGSYSSSDPDLRYTQIWVDRVSLENSSSNQ